jgi:hypothetical protein
MSRLRRVHAPASSPAVGLSLRARLRPVLCREPVALVGACGRPVLHPNRLAGVAGHYRVPGWRGAGQAELVWRRFDRMLLINSLTQGKSVRHRIFF